MEPSQEEFDKVKEELKSGTELNFVHLHRIFGQSLFQLMLLSLIDARYSMLPEEIKKARKK